MKVKASMLLCRVYKRRETLNKDVKSYPFREPIERALALEILNRWNKECAGHFVYWLDDDCYGEYLDDPRSAFYEKRRRHARKD